MTVPETAMHQHHGPVFRQHYIWAPGETLHMEPISQAQRMQGAPQKQFWLGIPSTDTRHHPRSSDSVYNVYHAIFVLASKAGLFNYGSTLPFEKLDANRICHC